MIRDHLWSDILRASSPKNRKRLKAKVLEAISFFNSKWKKSKKGDETVYEFDGKDKSVEQLVRDLKSEKGLKFVGFSPSVRYILMDGNDEAMKTDWEHPFGGPALLYAHKSLPILIIAGPEIMYNDSYVKKLNPDFMKDSIGGITD